MAPVRYTSALRCSNLARAGDRQQAGDGDLASVAARAKPDLPPLNGGPECAFGCIVRRFDSLLVDEGEAALLSRPASAKSFFSSGSTFVINWSRESGAPRPCGSPRNDATTEETFLQGERLVRKKPRCGRLRQFHRAEQVSHEVLPTELALRRCVGHITGQPVAAENARERRTSKQCSTSEPRDVAI
jgi:hypothetical protein